jgi:hypothetical protein
MVGIAFLVAYVRIAAMQILPKHGIAPPVLAFDDLIYALLMASFILFITLPGAILLWSEPDMEGEG